MSAGKGSKPRPIDRKQWDNSKLWHNINKKKLKESTQEVLKVTKKAGDEHI